MNVFPKSNLILRLIKEKCKSDGITQKQLCYGICDAAYISRCIANDIEMDKLMLDALMQRLGMSVRNYMYILRDSEYQYFIVREKIRMCIREHDTENAKTLIEQYFKMIADVKGAKKLHQQIILLLCAYILEQENADLVVQMQNIDEAIECSIPHYSINALGEFLFSEVELLLLTRKAMLLEKMNREDEAYTLFYHLYDLQKGKTYSTGELTYIFVVVDYHLAKICLRKQEHYMTKKIAEKGVEDLSKNNKFLFAAELLEIISLLVDVGRIGRESRYNYDCIKKLVYKYMPEWNPDTYYPLYQEFSIYSFRKMVVQRRKMLGLTQEELSIKCCCDIATIERMEQGIVDTQSDIAYQILNTVGLPIEKCFYLLQTSSYVVKEKYIKLAVAINDNRIDEAKKILYEIKDAIDLSLVVNQQAVDFDENIIKNMAGDINTENRIDELVKILNLTMPIDIMEKHEGTILYANEINLVRNLAMCYEKVGKLDVGIKLLQWAKSGYEKGNNVGEENGTTYLSLLKLLESMYANKGEFEKANEILEMCIPKVIKQDIAGVVPQLIYDKAWNMLKQKGSIDEEKQEELRAAYEIAVFSNNMWITHFIDRLCNPQ